MKKDKSALFVKKCLKLFHLKVNSKTEKLLIQIFKRKNHSDSNCSGIAFIIDYLSLIVCKEVFHLNTLSSAAIAFTISVIYNYIASVKWVFDVNKEKNEKTNFIIFIVLSIVGLIITEIIMWLGSDVMGISYLIVKIVATAIVMVFNFITRKMFLE